MRSRNVLSLLAGLVALLALAAPAAACIMHDEQAAAAAQQQTADAQGALPAQTSTQ